MKKATNLYCVCITFVVAAQLFIAVLYDCLLCNFQNNREPFLLFVDKYMLPLIVSTICITAIVIPVFSVALRLYARRYKQQRLEEDSTLIEKQERKVKKCLKFLGVFVVICWFIFGTIVDVVVERRWGLSHGSDEYMAFGRPGVIFGLLPGIGVVISEIILFGGLKDTPWRKRQI